MIVFGYRVILIYMNPIIIIIIIKVQDEAGKGGKSLSHGNKNKVSFYSRIAEGSCWWILYIFTS